MSEPRRRPGTAATVLIEEIDGDDLVVRIRATPENPVDGARLADEVVEALSGHTRTQKQE